MQSARTVDSEFRLRGRIHTTGNGSAEASALIHFGEGRWFLKAKVEYQSLVQRFWGIGPDTADGDEELYRPQDVRSYVELFHRVYDRLRVGARVEWNDFRYVEVEDGGLLDTRDYPGLCCDNATGAGIVWEYDGRDDVYAPRRGVYVQGFWMSFSDDLNGDFAFQNVYLDLRSYHDLGGENVLALQAFTFSLYGDAPIWRYAQIGGREHSRGYRRGRYTDRRLAAVQAEWRRPLVGRFDGVAFAGGRGRRWTLLGRAPRSSAANAGDGTGHAGDRRSRPDVARRRGLRNVVDRGLLQVRARFLTRPWTGRPRRSCYRADARAGLDPIPAEISMKLRLLAIACAMTVAGCGVQNGEDASSSSSASTSRTGSSAPSRTAPADPYATPQQPSGGMVQLAGINFQPAEGWTDLGPSAMRKAQYQLSPVEGDAEPAEVNVFYFGAGQGGDIESNIKRWIGQMQTPDGGDATSLAVRSKLTTSHGLDVHFVEVDGTYMKSMGGGPMTGGRKKALEDYRMVGAIVVAPEGNVFFKLTGPVATAIAMEEGMRAMLANTTRI